jgi:hypothetical protein
MTVVLGGHLLLTPAPIATPAVTTMLSLVLVRLTHQTARARALRTLALVVGHADKSLHKAVPSTSPRSRRIAPPAWLTSKTAQRPTGKEHFSEVACC